MAVTTTESVASLSTELRSLQTKRVMVMKSRNMQSSRLQAVVAGTLGYDGQKMTPAERLKAFAQAAALIALVAAGEECDTNIRDEIEATLVGIDAFDEIKTRHERSMKKVAARLPVADWVSAPEQKGFGILSLAIVVGECGDLAGYANPAKLWRRMSCAPREFEGKTQMGSTWRFGKQGKLPACEWDDFGYSPRRRSISYLIGENIVKQNGDGPYKTRYGEAKAKLAADHPDDKNYPPMRCHRHGMLLGTKLLLKNLWIEWNR